MDGLTETGKYLLSVDPEARSEDIERSMAGRLKESLEETGAGDSPVMKLPEELNGGIEVRWFTGNKSYTACLLSFFIFSVAIIYLRRYDRINREIKEAEESLIKDLPEFINKLVLL